MDEDRTLPPECETILKKENGQLKKSILFVYDISNALTYGQSSLSRLEEVLGIFEREHKQIALWWRPQKGMEERLEMVSGEVAARYQIILDKYKRAGWGICDETDNVGRAVELCDAYYGDMSAVLQPFQNAGKPVMLATPIG